MRPPGSEPVSCRSDTALTDFVRPASLSLAWAARRERRGTPPHSAFSSPSMHSNRFFAVVSVADAVVRGEHVLDRRPWGSFALSRLLALSSPRPAHTEEVEQNRVGANSVLA